MGRQGARLRVRRRRKYYSKRTESMDELESGEGWLGAISAVGEYT